jgi:hypothetical protein
MSEQDQIIMVNRLDTFVKDLGMRLSSLSPLN